MPEHRPGTPGQYYVLESFLWREFTGVDDWLEWTEEHGLARTATSTREIFDQAMALRDALRSLEAMNNGERADDAPERLLNALIESLGVHPVVEPFGDVKLRARAATGRSAPIASILVMALDAMSRGVWTRFKLCQDPTCRASFYDATKNGTKTWCSVDVCGARNKMRRLRERQKG
ncbi:MAG TPA: CGNR zinc finger domain-containing protein [Gemmatimonadaceae bacterium]|nr:CGNR zinc finger domain-containing protein [Gemmatimonadaceae bacterium]